jgi:Putative auto-transporter adhesin, head GIN domain
MHTAPTHVHRRLGLFRDPVIWLVAIALLVAGALLAGRDVFQTTHSSRPDEGSGVPATATRHVKPFSAVELAGSNDVAVHVGAEQSVAVSGDDNLLEFVTTEVRGAQLVIANSTSFSTAEPMRVDVTVPTLDAITLSGSGRLTVDGIDTGLLTVTLGGSGVVYAQGRADRVEATLTGSGDLELQHVQARDAYAVVSGSGPIWIYATRSVDARVPGTGAVIYSGDPPRVTRNVSGTGAVVAR